MPFKKGQSGNPGGRPKRDWTWSGELQKAVEEMAKDGQAIKFKVVRSLLAEALKGNINAQRELMNRMDGMPQQDVTSGGESIQSVIVYKPEKNEE